MFLKRKIDFGSILLACGLLSQVVVYIVTKDSFLSFVSGIAGMISVVQCSEKKMSYYFWSFLQMSTYTIICVQEGLHGKIVENLFYFLTMITGVFIWLKNLDDEKLVKTKSLDFYSILGVFGVAVGLTVMGWGILDNLGDSHPMFDSITTVLGILAQILMMLRYKENWILWFIQDIICIAMWASIENWFMVVQYVFWTINCVYGFILWGRKNLYSE